ncbi:MAG: ATP-binding cassette domain-containing protein [Spirochaetota bacterium]
MNQLHFNHVTFTYPGLVDPLLADVSFVAPAGWTGVVGANGAGKSTLLALATGTLAPQGGTITRAEAVVTCEQRTDAPPPELADLLCYPDADAGRLASILGLEGDWPFRWETLSHGERKRAQIAVALWRRPELLVVDEPTNHLDREAKEQLATALEEYRGVGLIVSHDRRLLDRLCRQCVFLEGGGEAVVRPGGVSSGLEQRSRERLEQRRRYEQARDELRRVEAEAARRREEASVQNRKRSKRSVRWRDSDAREKIDRARISGADGQAGRLLNQMDGRRTHAAERLAELGRPVSERVGVTVRGKRAKRDALLRREAGTLALPDGRGVALPELVVAPDDRIALQGPNGAGKTTLVRALLREGGGAVESTVGMEPATELPSDVLWIPQEITAERATTLAEEVRSLEHAALGRVISTVSRLGSDPEKLLQTERPSPGETRKLMLALGLEREPVLVVMDEPTNHLDLASMQCLETALADFAGALLLVSHDDAFVAALARTLWVISDGYLEAKPTPPA